MKFIRKSRFDQVAKCASVLCCTCGKLINFAILEQVKSWFHTVRNKQAAYLLVVANRMSLIFHSETYYEVPVSSDWR